MQSTLYTITPIAPRQLRVKAGKFKWNLAQADLDSVVNNPITTSDDTTVFTAVAVLTRTDTGFEGHTYYLEEENTPHGWDSTDCELVVAEPMPTPHILPAGALPVPVNVTDLTLVVSVKGYTSKTEAANDVNAKIALPEGEYLVFTVADNGMACIGQSRGGIKYWINPADNQLPVPEEPEPVPNVWVSPRENSVKPEPVEEPEIVEPESVEDWKASYVEYPEPRIYKVNQEGRAWNEAEEQPEASVMLWLDQEINVYGWFVREGQKYYRLKVKRDTGFKWWVAVPQMYNGRAVLTLPAPTMWDRIFHRTLQLKSIFTDEDPKMIDSLVNPYSKTKEK